MLRDISSNLILFRPLLCPDITSSLSRLRAWMLSRWSLPGWTQWHQTASGLSALSLKKNCWNWEFHDKHDKHMCVSIFILKFIYTYYVIPTIDCTFLRAGGALHGTSLISKLLWLSADGRSGKLSHFSVSRRSSFQTSMFSTLHSSGVVYCQTRVSTDITYNL